MILIIKHIDIEGAGTLEDFFGNAGRSVSVINVSAGVRLPETLAGVEAVVCLGGPMNVYEEDKHPFLIKENSILKKALARRIPVLGICLGAQLLAKACGARVSKSPVKEIGWYKILQTPDAKHDRLFSGLKEELSVFEWHEDTFELPVGGILLAEGSACRNQAFRVGDNAYGIQFHIEVTPEMIETWISHYTKDGHPSQAAAVEMLRKSREDNNQFYRQARKIYLNFAEIIGVSRAL
ncbi:MAG: type 1 glutamine amidotransferase [Candidatus Omnitrophota bacterium]